MTASRSNNGRHGFGRFLALVAANGLISSATALFVPIYFQELGLSGIQTGIYFAFTSAAALLLALPVGVSSDRMSIAKILALGLALTAIHRLGFLVSRTFAWFCLYALLGSFGARFYGTAIQALFFKLSGDENRQKTGYYMLTHFASSAVGMVLGGWLIQRFDFRASFLFGLVGNLLMALFALRLPKNDTVQIELAEYKRAVLQPNVLLLTGIFFLSSLHWGAEQTSYLPFLKQNLGLSIFDSSLYVATALFCVGSGTYLGSWLLERKLVKDLPTLLWIGLLMGGVFHILMTVPHVGLSLVFRCLHEIGDGFAFLVYYHGIAKVFRLEKIGGCAAFVSLWMAVGALFGSLIYGWMGARFGHHWPLIMSGILLILVPPLLRPRRAGFDGEYGLA